MTCDMCDNSDSKVVYQTDTSTMQLCQKHRRLIGKALFDIRAAERLTEER